jgi:hypothetical protein
VRLDEFEKAHWSLPVYGELILADASGVESLASCR